MGAQPAATVDFVADITCPWCMVGRLRLDAALVQLARDGLVLDWRWRPYLIHPDAPAAGYPQREHLVRRFGSPEAAGRYHDGVVEAGRAVGFDFRYDRIQATPNTVDAHRLLLHADRLGAQHHLASRLARAFFTEGADIGRLDVLTSLALDCGLEGAREMLGSDRFRAAVRAADLVAKGAGIRAVPAFCLHGKVLSVPDIDDLPAALLAAHRALGRPLPCPPT